MNRKIRLCFILSAALTISCLMTVPGWAAAVAADPSEAGKTQAELNGYSEEEWARLMDDTLEYSEIPDLVHCFNPSIAAGWTQYTSSARDILDSVNLMNDAGKKAEDYYKTSKQQYDIMSPYMTPEQRAEALAGLAALKASSDAAGTMAGTLNNTYHKMQRISSYNASLRQGEKQLTSAVRQIFAGYETVLANRVMLEKLVQLYSESVNAYTAMLSQGMSTSSDLLKAQNDLMQAQASLSSLTVTERQLYDQLITLCGWKAGANVSISSIRVPDAGRLASCDPAKDITEALGNNYALWAYRDEGHDHSSAGLDVYFGREAELESKIRIELDKAAAGVTAARQGHDAAAVGLQSAALTRQAAKAQYDQGLTSKAQYLGTEIAAVQKESAYTTAVIALEQAAAAYEDVKAGLFIPD